MPGFSGDNDGKWSCLGFRWKRIAADDPDLVVVALGRELDI